MAMGSVWAPSSPTWYPETTTTSSYQTPEQRRFEELSYQRALEALERDQPRFGTIPTLTRQQQTILSQLMGMGEPTRPRIWSTNKPRPQAGMAGMAGMAPTYAPIDLAGAGERGAALSRMMAVSPEEEAAAIEAMSAPAMRQFGEQILPGIRGAAAATGTTWSTMRAGEEARAGAGLAENLAALGEQYRLQRRAQAMQAAGLGTQEALGGVQAGLTRYGTEMQPYMQARQLEAEQGMQTQRLEAEQSWRRQQTLAQLLGTPMMAYYSY